MKQFDALTKLKECLYDFENKSVSIAKSQRGDNLRYLNNETYGVDFSQSKMINKIDFAINSVFESGQYDTEGQRKVYLNIVRFIRDVSRMNTDIDVKNYVFIPETRDDLWSTYFMSKSFKIWAKDENYGEILNRLGDDYVTYGTCVLKRIGNEVVRVPIRSLRNTQDAESLSETVECGGYVIEEHEMSVYEMKEMKDWKIEGLDESKKHKVYEMYVLAPKSYIAKLNGRKDSSDEMVQGMFVICLDKDEKGKKEESTVLFVEEIDEVPYEEARWETIDGRWLGRGPVEQQLENQIARNMTANLRRRALLHSSKHVYQTANEEVAKNLVKEVRDGQVMYVGPNGAISPVSNETRNLGEFSADEAIWKENSQQQSFTFESATGESMTSGTPFRLGVLLSNTVMTHYELKKEQLGLFLKRSYFSQLVPIFQKQSRAKTLALMSTDENIGMLKDAVITLKTNERYVNEILNGTATTYDDTKARTQQELNSSPFIFVDIPDKYFKDIKCHLDLNITDESSDTKAEIETLTNLYTIMSQKGDPRADSVLETILSKTGRNLSAIAGKSVTQPVTQPSQTPQGGQLTNLIPQTQNVNTTV